LAQIPVEGENIDPVTHQNRVDQVKRDLTQIRNQKEKRLILEQQIEDITAQWKEISFDDTLTQRMTEMSKEIEDADFHLKTAQKIDLLVDQQNKLEKEKTNLEELYTYLTDLQRLRTIALEVEGHALQETIDSINNVLSDIASTLFDKDREMSIRLSAFKQLKTKDRIKPMINLGIKYGNGEYDNVNQLSGGEGDRISLAITLALSRLNTCPLLLLDECMASLDADLKEVCLGAIRDAVGGTKTVIIINHEGTEGHYDHVVQLDD
jgi:DNA repair exonuclease SbcCD ATPase subunit